MNIVSACSLPVASLTWQPRPGAFAITVVCKATFSLHPGECVFADEQEPLHLDEIPWSDEPSRSPVVASDLAPLKPRAEVVLVGHAFAPERTPARSLVARLVVGELDKSIEIWCDRVVGDGGAIAEGAAFERMPLVYERAAGGPATWNPVGLPPDALDPRGRRILPNLLHPGSPMRPIGFGPIAPNWPLRRDKLGRRAAHGLPTGFAREPMPPDLDPAYFQAAPPDQQLAALRGDELIVLENLHRDIPRLITALPGVMPSALAEVRGAPQPLALRCDRLWIDTDRAICSLTFRAEMPLARPDEKGRIMIFLDRPAGKGASSPQGLTLPFSPGGGRSPEPALPFAPAPIGAPPPAEGRASPGAARLPFGAPSTPVLQPFAAFPAAPPLLHVIDRPARAEEATPPRLTAEAPPPALTEPPVRGEAIGNHETLDLLWFDPEAVPRIRRTASFRKILDDLADQPIDPELDDPETARNVADVENQRDLGEILLRGEPRGAEGPGEALRAGNRRGRFVPQYSLFEGDLHFPFDEIGALRATVITVTPLIAGDESLKAAVLAANEFLRIPGLFSAPAVAEGLTGRIKDTFRQGKRMVPVSYLEAQVERALLEQRLYQRRSLFGGPHVRALLSSATAPVPVAVYLGEAAAARLPLFQRFRARLIGAAHPAVDQFEPAPTSIRAAALARIVVLER